MVLNRQQKRAGRVDLESQCNFRTEYSTIHMIFCLLQMQEKCRKQNITFVDLIKAFDHVSQDGLLRVLAKIGCLPMLLCVTKSFQDARGAV